jgi:hypothetical protein
VVKILEKNLGSKLPFFFLRNTSGLLSPQWKEWFLSINAASEIPKPDESLFHNFSSKN